MESFNVRPAFFLFLGLQTRRSRFWIFRKKIKLRKTEFFLSDAKFKSGSRFQIYEHVLPVLDEHGG